MWIAKVVLCVASIGGAGGNPCAVLMQTETSHLFQCQHKLDQYIEANSSLYAPLTLGRPDLRPVCTYFGEKI